MSSAHLFKRLLIGMFLAGRHSERRRGPFSSRASCPQPKEGAPPRFTSARRLTPADPRFIDKVAPTKLWVQTEPGNFRHWK